MAKENSNADGAKPRTLQTFLLAECANITDFVKQRKSVDLEKLFFGQDGYLDDDNEDDEQEEVEPKDVKADGVEKSPTTEKPKESEDTDRKSEDTSSGVADLSPDNSPPSPDQPNASDAVRFEELEGLEGRRLSLGWEKVQTLYLRTRLQGGKDGEDPAAGSRQSHRGGRRFNSKRDKRVRTALRRLLNERLFGNVKKKSRRDDDNADNWTNADSVGNNVSVASSAIGTRTGTRQTVRSVPQGKVAFADEDSDKGGLKGRGALKLGGRSPSTLVGLAPGAPQRNPDDSNTEEESAENIGQERQPTRSSSRLPPLRTPQVDMSRVFTPANYPKWGLCVTASQRSMLVDGLERDRTFLSRQHAKTAWNSKGDDDLIVPPRSQETRGGDTTDDESYLDPHRPNTDSFHNSDRHGQQQWAHKRADHRAQSVAFTSASGRSPLDIDDRRLRRLLEELYRDKKFMDKLINKIDEEHLEFPDTIASEDVKFLSEFGRQYLLERALYWEQTGPLGPPRPPPTALGMRIKRAQTMASGMSNSSSQDMTSPRPKTVR